VRFDQIHPAGVVKKSTSQLQLVLLLTDFAMAEGGGRDKIIFAIVAEQGIRDWILQSQTLDAAGVWSSRAQTLSAVDGRGRSRCLLNF